MTCFPGNQVDWIAAILRGQFSFHLIGCLKRERGSGWNLDIFPWRRTAREQTSDWSKLCWSLCCLRKGVANKEQHGSDEFAGTYGRLLLLVATPKAQPLGFFCFLFFPFHRFAPSSASPPSFISPLSRDAAAECVFVAAQLSHVLHFTLLLLSGCRGESGQSLRATAQSVDVKCFFWRWPDRRQLNPSGQKGFLSTHLPLSH